MSLQTCKRCRKRRIKCDLELPSCGNCILAGGLECLFFDEALGQEFPRSYLHALQGKVRDLEAEIESLTSRNELDFNSIGIEGYHPGNPDNAGYHLNVPSRDDASTVSNTIFLGPGSAAHLVQSILKGAAKASEARSSQILSSLRVLSESSTSSSSPPAGSAFQTVVTNQKLEPWLSVPPSTQRALFDHYSKVIQPDYAILSPEQEEAFSRHENPLRWCLTNPDHHEAFALIAVFAISTSLVARDVNPELQAVSFACRDALWKTTQQAVASLDVHRSFFKLKQIITAFVFLSILEMIHPSTGQIWELVGSGMALMETVRAEYPPAVVDLDEEFQRLEFLLLKIESSIAFHFRRPSTFCNNWSLSSVNPVPPSSNPYHSLAPSRAVRQIAHGFTLYPPPEEAYFLNLIPYELRIEPGESNITFSQAYIYLSLHPLFTSSISNDLCSSAGPHQTSLELFQTIAKSAAFLIEFLTQRSRDRKMISLWMAAERLLEAGAVWGVYLMTIKHTLPESNYAGMGMASALKPLQSCSTLFASFAERWREGSVYMDIWEIYLTFLWTII